jgi:diaminopimelate decarboxylase
LKEAKEVSIVDNRYKTTYSAEDLYRLAKVLGTPYYIIDERSLKERLKELREAYKGFEGETLVAYSVKANFNPFLLQLFVKEGTYFDVTSPEELYFLLNSGGKPERVIYTSITEGRQEFKKVLGRGVKKVVISSYNGLLHLIEAAMAKDVRPEVLIRIHPDVDVKAEIKSSHGKFGVPFDGSSLDTASSLLRLIYGESNLEFLGFHFHLGSQIIDPECYIQALEKLERFIFKMKRELPKLEVKMIDIGGGTPVNYGVGVPTPKEMAKDVVEKLNLMKAKLGSSFTLVVESGRYLSAEAVSLISEIVNIKVCGRRKFVFVDTGYHQLLDAALLHQIYPVEVVPNEMKEEQSVVLVGRLCDDLDIFPLGPDTELDGVEVGKLVMFKNVGAYSIVFNMPFHSQVKPAIAIRKEDGKFYLARRRQELKELFLEEGGDLLLDPRPL